MCSVLKSALNFPRITTALADQLYAARLVASRASFEPGLHLHGLAPLARLGRCPVEPFAPGLPFTLRKGRVAIGPVRKPAGVAAGKRVKGINFSSLEWVAPSSPACPSVSSECATAQIDRSQSWPGPRPAGCLAAVFWHGACVSIGYRPVRKPCQAEK
jgi:hypothetical protein